MEAADGKPAAPVRRAVAARLATLAFSTLLACIAGILGVRTSREYYRVAPFHDDSASSRLHAVRLWHLRESAGLGAALQDAVLMRDALDRVVRLVVAPRSLLMLRGHLLVLLPLLALFLFLLQRQVESTTGSWGLGAGLSSLVLCLPLVHDPVGGISDYRQEALATWLLAAALVAWLRSEGLERRPWGLLSGSLLGLLAMQRTVAAVYSGAVFAPLALAAAWRRLRAAGAKRAGLDLACFVLPGAVAAAAVAVLQGARLYRYYFVTGYGYGTVADVGLLLLGVLPAALGMAAAAFVAAAALLAGSGAVAKPNTAARAAAWAVLALPLGTALSGAFYGGFDALWVPLLLVLLAALPSRPPPRSPRSRAAALFLLAALGACAQHAISWRDSRTLAASLAGSRRFYEELVQEMLGGNPSARYGTLFFASDTLFVNHAFFDRGIWPTRTVAYAITADSYYHAEFPGKSAAEITTLNVQRLQEVPGTLAVAHCHPSLIPGPGALGPDHDLYGPFARQVASEAACRLLMSPLWRVRRRFDSPYGCLYLYELAPHPLSSSEKWGDVRPQGQAARACP